MAHLAKFVLFALLITGCVTMPDVKLDGGCAVIIVTQVDLTAVTGLRDVAVVACGDTWADAYHKAREQAGSLFVTFQDAHPCKNETCAELLDRMTRDLR